MRVRDICKRCGRLAVCDDGEVVCNRTISRTSPYVGYRGLPKPWFEGGGGRPGFDDWPRPADCEMQEQYRALARLREL